MKVILINECGSVRILEGTGSIESNSLNLRNRLAGGDLTYYELDYNEGLKMPIDAYVAALNRCPKILDNSAMIKKI